eukprot:5973251-Amphidinium_carterae.2
MLTELKVVWPGQIVPAVHVAQKGRPGVTWGHFELTTSTRNRASLFPFWHLGKSQAIQFNFESGSRMSWGTRSVRNWYASVFSKEGRKRALVSRLDRAPDTAQ